ncbi:MAG: dTDP-glucose 4,6-dehydratase, partial [Candidatus Omnitrophota bacterium]|nr:dTDP-glucose 4,6-dehydratase [Candidatus Omnitrophota bacterium]
GKIGEVYNIGASFEIPNIELTKIILKFLGKTDKMINYVSDRLGHDRRYSLDSTKVRKLGWKPSKSFDTAIKETINWYKANTTWWQKLK